MGTVGHKVFELLNKVAPKPEDMYFHRRWNHTKAFGGLRITENPAQFAFSAVENTFEPKLQFFHDISKFVQCIRSIHS